MSKLLALLLFSFALLALSSVNNQYYVTSTLDITTKNGFPGLFSTASYKGTDKYYLKPKSTIAKTLNITFTYDSDQEFTIHITRGEAPPRYFMPYEFPYSYTKTKPRDLASPDYDIEIIEDPFSINVVRKSTGETIFNTSAFDFVYSEFYVAFGTKLPSRYLYGFGERRKSFLYKSGLYTIWNKDNYGTMDEGKGGQQTYGSHPVGLIREASGKWHVMFLRTTNALDFNFDSTEETLKFKMTGGEIELKFFLGNEYPDTAIKQYHNYINGWALTPFWSHGYHQCKWGYLYIQDAVTVVDQMHANDLPIDVIWSDIDYMVNFIDFTIDPDRYNLTILRNLTDRIHWIPIIDSGVFLDYNAPAYAKGTEYDIWIRSANDHDKYLVGVVWPGVVHWPDWLHPNASKYWSEMLNLLYSSGRFSGIWIDMNENTNFCFGESPNKCGSLENYLPNYVPSKTPNPVLGNETVPAEKDPITDKFEFISFKSADLPYEPGNMPLEYMALSLNALHYGKVLSFDFHNLDPFFEAMYTHQALMNITEERPFILTRGTFAGSGQFSAHWTGDNMANWDHLRDSIPELFDFQVFGVPMVGVDICGFGGNTEAELCARWMQLGAFYPFMRNHNALGNIPQEPYALGPVVLETSRAALKFRYSILKFYYSIFVRNNATGTVFRPVFFDFPNDILLLSLDNQFLIGSELMVPSVLQPGLTQTNVYFPGGVRWYNFSDGKLMVEKNEGPIDMPIDAPLNTILPVFIKGGSIVHTQDVQGVKRTNDLSSVFNLVVALEPINKDTSVAFGQMMGIIDYQLDASVDKCLGVNDCLVNIAAIAVTGNDGKVSASVSFSLNTPESTLEEISISEITFYGVRTEICNIQDPYCDWGNVAIKCAYQSPKVVKLETVSFILDKENCTF